MEPEFEDDIFDRNIDQLDVRETPRWELSEEEDEPCEENHIAPLVNQQKDEKIMTRVPPQANPSSVPVSTNIPPNQRPPGANIPSNQRPPGANIPPNPRPLGTNIPSSQRPAGNNVLSNQRPPGTNIPSSQRPPGNNVLSNPRPPINPLYQPQPGQKFQQMPRTVVPVQPQSPILAKGGPRSSTSTTESVKTVMSPILLPRNLDKKKIEELVKAAYQDDGDSVKDFGAAEREKRPPVNSTVVPSKDVMNRLPHWDDDDADSIKDYTGNDRKKEEQYMVRTDEAIYQRASEEHIKRPPLWHDEEVDSLRDFGRISGKQEVPSGIMSQQLSRVPSDEEICLSPPWIEEDDGQVRNMPCPQTDCKSFTMGKMMAEQRIQQVPPWHEDDSDSTKNYAEFWKLGSKENSRRPSDENIYLTPPWMEDDRESCGNHSASSQMTLDEKHAIEEEVRSSGVVPTKPQALNEEQHDSTTETQLPGRDSGFCSEQDQHQQTQVCTDGQDFEAIKTSVIPSDLIPNVAPVPINKEPIATVDNIPTTNQLLLPTKELPRPKETIEAKCLIPQHPEEPRLPAMFLPQVPLIPGNVRSKQDELLAPVVPLTTTRLCDVDDKGIARSISQSSLEANCYSPHDALDGLETSSVVSFASTAATHHDLDTRIDMMQSLISLLGTHDKDDMSRTLLAMSNSKDSCAAMRQSGCLPLLIDLIHGHDNPMARRDCRSRAGLALHNIVYSNPEDRRGRREIRVLRLLEVVRAHCDAVMYSNLPPHPCAERWYPPLLDHGPGPAVAALMKLSFEEEHRTAICELGGCQAVAELIEIDHKVNAECNDLYSVGLRKYAGMTLTNLTFGNTKNKTILCKMDKTVKALIAQLKTTKQEELVQVSASVLRNLSWRADEVSRDALRKVGAVRGLTEAAQKAQSETVLRTLLSGLWNLSAHCPENKTELCNIPGALRFIVRSLSYCSPSGNMSVVESSGGILRNLSSHIAVLPECRKILRDNACFQTLLNHLRSPSVRVVGNACGALWNLSARCIEDQELLWELGAVSVLKSLVSSKHKAIATAAAAALRNLMAVKPTSYHGTDTESVSSRTSTKRYRSNLPSTSRQLETQTKHCKPPTKERIPHHRSHSTRAPQLASPRTKSPEVHRKPLQYPQEASNYHGGSSSSLDQQATREKVSHTVEPRDVPRDATRRPSGSLRKANAVDSSSVGSAASEGRHGHLARWSGSNDSLAQHRRHKNKSSQQKKAIQPADVAGQHSRSSSDGCAVIQLLTDSYPLQVTAKTNNNQHGEHAPVVSPATARRLNQWAEDQAIESIEMSRLYICSQAEQRQVPNPPRVAESRESLGSSSSRHRKKHAQKFRSYRDSESEREADIDSEEEKNVFGVKAGGFANAWIKRNDNRASKSAKNAATSQAPTTKRPQEVNRTCVCKEKPNIWMRRSKTDKNGFCKKCMKKENAEETRPVVKSRRDSSDSPLSSPNAVRSFTGDVDNDPSKRGVKVTSL